MKVSYLPEAAAANDSDPGSPWDLSHQSLCLDDMARGTHRGADDLDMRAAAAEIVA